MRKIAYGTMVKDGTGEHKVVFSPDFVAEGNGADNLMGNEYDFDGDQKQDLKFGNFSKGTEENIDADGNPTPGHTPDGTEKIYNLDVVGHITVCPSDIKKPTVGLDHMDVNGDGLYDTYFCCGQWYIRTINGETLKTFKMP